jgi:purine nucleosidase
MAIKLRPDLRNMVKEIFILGGNMEGMGNITVSSEFNFFVDPEASFVVLENFSPCPITILPWETSAKFGTLPHVRYV